MERNYSVTRIDDAINSRIEPPLNSLFRKHVYEYTTQFCGIKLGMGRSHDYMTVVMTTIPKQVLTSTVWQGIQGYCNCLKWEELNPHHFQYITYT